MAWFDEIATPSALIVFLVAVVLTGAARFGFGPRRASLGPALVVPLAVFAVAGPPNFLTESLLDQISILALAGFVLGAFLDLEHFDLWPRRAMIIVAPFAGLAWMIVRGRPTRHDRGRPQFYSGGVDRITDRHRPRWSNVGKCDDSTHPIGDHGHRSKFIGVDRGRAGPCSNQRGNRVGVGRIFRLELAVVPVPPPARLLLLARPSRWRQQLGRWCWRTGFQAPVSPSWASFFSVIGRWDLYLWAAAAWPAPCGRCWSSPSPPW